MAPNTKLKRTLPRAGNAAQFGVRFLNRIHMFKKILILLAPLFFLGFIYFAYIYGVSVGVTLQQLNQEGLEARIIAMELEYPLPVVNDDGEVVVVQTDHRLEEQLNEKIIFFGRYLEIKKYLLFYSDEEESNIVLFEDAINYRLENMDYYKKYGISEPYTESTLDDLIAFMESDEDFPEELKKKEIDRYKLESEYYHDALNYFRK